MSVYDFDTISSALKILTKEKVSYKFYIAGRGEYEKKIKKKFQKNKNVIFLGWIDRNSSIKISQKCHIALAPYQNIINYKLNLVNKFIDYMSLGIPVLTPLDGYVRSIIVDYKIGWNYEPNNPIKLSKLLIKIINQDEDIKIRSRNAFNLYKKKYTFQIVYENLVRNLEEINNGKL